MYELTHWLVIRVISRDLAEVVLVGRVVERVLVAFEQGQVRMHPRARQLRRGLWHKRRVHVSLGGEFLDDEAIGHDGVCHCQRIGVTQIDLVLARCDLVVGKLHRNAHLLEDADRVSPKILRDIEWREIEVAARIHGRRIVDALEKEELHLGMDVEGEAALSRFVEVPSQDKARISPERPAVR